MLLRVAVPASKAHLDVYPAVVHVPDKRAMNVALDSEYAQLA